MVIRENDCICVWSFPPRRNIWNVQECQCLYGKLSQHVQIWTLKVLANSLVPHPTILRKETIEIYSLGWKPVSEKTISKSVTLSPDSRIISFPRTPHLVASLIWGCHIWAILQVYLRGDLTHHMCFFSPFQLDSAPEARDSFVLPEFWNRFHSQGSGKVLHKGFHPWWWMRSNKIEMCCFVGAVRITHLERYAVILMNLYRVINQC